MDPKTTTLRWGIVTTQREYYVPWPNSPWHLDGYHFLIRWGFVIHGFIHGYSRKVIFLECSNNNFFKPVLILFIDAIKNDGGRWPSRTRIDYNVKKLLVCDKMIEKWEESRSNFIARLSTRNQRIERLWRDIFRCVIHMFYYIFYALEKEQLIDIESPINKSALRLVSL